MAKYALKRLLMLIPLILIISIIIFSMIHLMPGDPAKVIAGEGATEQDIANVSRKYGFDRPYHEQYLTWAKNVLKGELGTSIRTNRPVVDEIGFRFVNTMKLAVLSMLIASVLGISLGIISATKRYSLADNLTMILAMLGVSVTPFYLGLMLIIIFSVNLNWLPMMGLSSWQHWILPAVTLAARPTAMIARMTRSNMLEVMSQDYILASKSHGLPDKLVVYKYALRNALNSVITVIGLQLGNQLGGAVITETVFSLPGLGRLGVTSITARDFPAVQASILLMAVSFVVINLIVDLLYAYINPKISYN